MKIVVRISALALIVAAAFAGSSASVTAAVTSKVQSSVPGGGGPMPTCNPFVDKCPTIR